MAEKQFIPLGSVDHCLTEVHGAGQRFLCFPFCTRRASEPDILLFVKPSALHAVELLTEANSESSGMKTDESPIFNIGHAVSFVNRNKTRKLVTSF